MVHCAWGLSQEAEPWTRWGDEPGPGFSPDHQEILAGTGVENELQPRSKIQPGDRHKAGCLEQGCGFLVGLIEITEAYRGHKDLKSCCRLEPRTPGSSYWRMVSLKYRVIHVALRVHSWGSRPLPANPIRIITKPSDAQYWHNRYYPWLGRPWSFPVYFHANRLKWEIKIRVLRFVPPLCFFFPNA